jgi:hypothetical protein
LPAALADNIYRQGGFIKTGSTYGLVTTALLVLAFFVLPHLWSWALWPYIILAILLVAGIFLVRWHARHTGYSCGECDFRFLVSAWVDFLSPHKAGVKMLRCPRCGTASWCEEIDRDMISKTDGRTEKKFRTNLLSSTGMLVQMLVVIIIYAAIWIYTFNYFMNHPDISVAFDFYRLPLLISILPALHVIFCGFGASQGYHSRIYPAITGFIILFLLFAAWMQYSLLNG